LLPSFPFPHPARRGRRKEGIFFMRPFPASAHKALYRGL
jgi:hypothetical protein